MFSWVYLHQGGRYDTNSGLYNFRNRDYSPTLGRWMQQDPIGYRTGETNLYRYEHDGPAGLTDPKGLDAACNVYLNCYVNHNDNAAYTFYLICEGSGNIPWEKCVRRCLAQAYACNQGAEQNILSHYVCWT